MGRSSLFLLLPVPLLLVAAVVWQSAGPAVPSPAEAAERSLQARSVDVLLTVDAAGAPPFRATGRATMSPPETRWRIGASAGDIVVVITARQTRVRAGRESTTVPTGTRAPFDDVPALMGRIAAGHHHDLDVAIGRHRRIARVTTTTRNARVTVRLSRYRA